MPAPSPSARRATLRGACRLLLAATVPACALDRPVAPTGGDAATADDPALAAIAPMAFTASVDSRTRVVRITAPTTTTAGANRAASPDEAPGVSLSLLGGDAVRVVATNVRVDPAPSATGRVRVRFDVLIENRLPRVRLVAPTWPVPPVARVLLFPLRPRVATSSGGVSGTNGNTVVVTQAGFGTVVASADFDGDGTPGSGAPVDFFTERPCDTRSTATCVRWKAFDAEIAPHGRSSNGTIGFEMDATVQAFTAPLIVAADLAPAATPAPAARVGRAGR